MAAEGLYSAINQILFSELKKRFQEVPELVIETVMIENGYVREKCIDALGRESHRYLTNYSADLPATHNQFQSLQITGTGNSNQQPHSFHGTNNIHHGKIHQPPGISNNGVRYPQPNPSRHYAEPVSAPVRPGDFEPFLSGVNYRAQPQSIPCSAYEGHGSGTSAAPNLVTHSMSHSGVFNRTDYRWSYSPQSNRPGNFTQTFEPPSYSPIKSSPQRQYPHGAYSPSHENYPAGQVINSPISSSHRSHLPSSPATPPSQQPQSLPPNVGHVPASSSALLGSPQVPAHNVQAANYPALFNRAWTMNGPEASLGDMPGPKDTQYEAALLHHQNDRLEKLLQDLHQSKEALNTFKERVTLMENKCLERRRKRRSNSFPSVEDVQKMRDENRKLRVEIGVLFTQIDGQTQLGTNPNQGQNFYSNIGTGQGGSIHVANQPAGAGDYQGATNNTPRPPPRRPRPPNFLNTERPPGSKSNPPSLGTTPSYTPPQNTPSPMTPPRHTASVSTPKQTSTWFVPPPIPEKAASHPNATAAAAAAAFSGQIDQGSMPPPRPPPPRPVTTVTPSRAPLVPPEREDRTSDDESDKWNCSACTFLNHPSLDKCEVCEMPRITGNFYSSSTGVR